MRPNSNVAERQGDLGGQKIAMRFDENSLAHLMTVMTDLYSDPELAVIREYSTNALDAQTAAGVSRPIEVSLPNGLSPFFKVKDFGIGMDISDIEGIYSQYGASTKRNSDDQVGMLGLGCKSALTYTQQFTLNSVKNGRGYQVAISRTENGSGIMEIVNEFDTDAPNGVEVVVPVKRSNEFPHKARNFFRFWAEGTVLIDGEEPEVISGRKVTNDILMVPQLDCDYLVMGNVAYPLSSAHAIGERSYHTKYGVVARVSIGDVNFTPSRESLHYTRNTLDTIKIVKDDFTTSLKTVVQQDIDAQDSRAKALAAYIEWYNMLGGGYHNRFPNVNYRGESIPIQVKHPFLTYKTNTSRYAVEGVGGMPIKSLAKSPIIYGFAGEKISGHQREKMRYWRTVNGFSEPTIVICDELPSELEKDWVPDDNIYSWEDVKKTKVAGEKSGRPKAVFDVFLPDAARIKSIPNDEFPDNLHIALCIPSELPDVRTMVKILKENPGYMVVRLQAYRWDKFKKDNPGTVELTSLLKVMYDTAVENLTDHDKFSMGLDYRARAILEKLNEKNIDDPAIVAAIKSAKLNVPSDTMKRYDEIRELVSKQSARLDIVSFPSHNPLLPYPLVADRYYAVNVPHTTIYLNAVYAISH
jgi:hypothetical protein